MRVLFGLALLALLALPALAVDLDHARRTHGDSVLDAATELLGELQNELNSDSDSDSESAVDMESEVGAAITFASDTATAHKTNVYRASSGGPVVGVTILRRHQSFTVAIPGATSATTYEIEQPKPARKRGKKGGVETAPLTVVKGEADKAELKHTQGAIGQFALVAKNGGKELARTSVIFIANPYVAADETYVPPGGADAGAVELAEHVENEKGALWQGSNDDKNWVPWAYNQFDVSVLEVAMSLLKELSLAQRASTALVVRQWTATTMRDVLEGNWSGDFKGGKEPGFWASTTQITEQHLRTKKIVKFGQCWVFAGVLTSFCRSSGIPARPLTNFDSAHEHQPFDQICKSNYHKKPDGEYEEISSDNSVWNFHVWVDAWMKRPDLANGGGDGWQAIDATFQEKSSGPAEEPFDHTAYRCGPASVNQIKEMAVTGPNSAHDVAFLAGEANCVQEVSLDGKLWYTQKDKVGENIITKAPDSKCNGEQKDADGYSSVCSTNVARSYSKVGSFLEMSNKFRSEPYRVLVNGKPNRSVRLGKAFKISVEALSGSAKAQYNIQVSGISYNSIHKFGVLKSVKADTAAGAVLQVTRDDWKAFVAKGVPSKTMTLQVFVTVTPPETTAKPFMYKKLVAIRPPKLAMACGKKQRKWQAKGTLGCKVQFFNPLPYPVKDATISFTVSGQSTLSEQVVAKELEVAKKEVLTPVPENFVATKTAGVKEVDANKGAIFKAQFPLNGAMGKQVIIAKLSSPDLASANIAGALEIEIVA